MNWNEIQGWSSEKDLAIYVEWARVCPEHCWIVELGTWLGRSAYYLLEQLEKAGKPNVRVLCVDSFIEDHLQRAAANLQRFSGRFRFVQWDVRWASGLFQPKSVWAVYEDSDHSYEVTMQVLDAWLPKIVTGGRMGGHDYNHKDWPGVVKAVNEVTGGITPKLYAWSWELPTIGQMR